MWRNKNEKNFLLSIETAMMFTPFGNIGYCNITPDSPYISDCSVRIEKVSKVKRNICKAANGAFLVDKRRQKIVAPIEYDDTMDCLLFET